MPDTPLWDSFFQPHEILRRLQLRPTCRDVVEFGCGYGTFTIPAAQIVSGVVLAIDIEPEMVAATERRAAASGLGNVRTILRDFVTDGTGLLPESCDYAMLFNILHAEAPLALLAEAYRTLARGGILGVMHWNYDPSTPRGPSMAIRPKPEQCVAWSVQCGFELMEPGIIDLPRYHYGFAAHKPATQRHDCQ